MRGLVNYLVKPDASLFEVIEVVDRGAAQIALVVDLENKLLGVITDGDIRRAMLRGKSLRSLAASAMVQDFHALSISATEEDALALMRRKTLHQIPVLDEKGRVVDLFLLEELLKPKKRSNSVVIMAGGEGRRLRPLTKNCPKPMLKIAGRPILEGILHRCIEAGFFHFYLAVNYLKDQIKDYFGDGTRWNVRIDYLEESHPLGTGGALSLIPQKLNEPLLVLNGDILARVDYGRLLQFHENSQAAATLCVREYTSQIPYGVVNTDDLNVLSVVEKPVFSHYLNAGIYLINPVLLPILPHDQFFDMPCLLNAAIQQKYRVVAYPMYEDWLDIGRHENLQLAEREWNA